MAYYIYKRKWMKSLEVIMYKSMHLPKTKTGYTDSERKTKHIRVSLGGKIDFHNENKHENKYHQ